MGAVGPRRSPSEGGYARGQETRLRIIETAIPLFARLGFENTSTREIAAEAGVNPPALQYYFDSKEGLYRACAEHIADLVTELLNPELDRAERLLRDGEPPQALIEGYCGLIAAYSLAQVWFSRSRKRSRIIGKAMPGPRPACSRAIIGDQLSASGRQNSSSAITEIMPQ